MSLDIGFTADWADGEYHFRLGVKQLDELQDICGIGAEQLYWRFTSPIQSERNWKTKWMRDAIRLALIGGKAADAAKAEKLCRMYVDDEPVLPNLHIAIGALGGALMGIREAVEGKTEAAETNDPTTTAPAGSTSPQSTETSPQ